jgi:hypothetical protein
MICIAQGIGDTIPGTQQEHSWAAARFAVNVMRHVVQSVPRRKPG